MRRCLLMNLLPLMALVFLSGCFYDPDEDKIGKTAPQEEGTGTTDGTDECFPGTDADGFGGDCEADADCAEGDADFCLKNPMSQSTQGVCSVESCDVGCCPDGFVCCDCSGVGTDLGWTVACVPEAEASAAAGFCTCG